VSLWGANNAQSNAPKWKVVEDKVAATSSTGDSANLFNNVSVGVFHNNQVLGVFGANVSDTSASGKISGPGWHYLRMGTGPVTSITISAGGSGFVNLAVGTVQSPQTGGNSNFSVSTNSTGGITTVTLLDQGGAGFNNSSTLTMIPPANGIVNVAIVAGGSGYANGEGLTVSNGQINAAASLTTNSTGGITAVTFSSAGRGFGANTTCVVTITTAGGTSANLVVNHVAAGTSSNLVPVLGGRAGRMHYECLASLHIQGSPPATLP
jgi:hypothetical protein